MTKAPLRPPVSESDDPEYATNLRRATLASTVGSALEYDDFALYGLASALIFSQLFFTNVDPAVGLVASFATSGVPGWWLISLGQSWLVIVVIALGIGFGVNAMLGPQCAMLPELFGNKHRYLGVDVTREFSAVIAACTNLYCWLVADIDASEFRSRNRTPPNVNLVNSGRPCQ